MDCYKESATEKKVGLRAKLEKNLRKTERKKKRKTEIQIFY